MDQLDPRIPLMVQPPAPIDPLRIASQVQGMRIQREQAAALEEQRRSMAELRSEQTAKLQREADREAAGQAVVGELLSTWEPGKPLPTATVGKLYQTWGPEKASTFVKGLLDMGTADLTNADAVRASMRKRVAALKLLPPEQQPNAYATVAQDYISRGVMKPEEVPPWRPGLLDEVEQSLMTPEQRANLTKPIAVSPGTTLINPVTKEPVYTAPNAPSPALREYQDAVSQGYKGSFQQYQTEDANRKRPVTMLSGMNAMYAQTDPKAIAAGIRSGEMPPDIAQYGRPVQGAIASELAKPGPNGERFNLADAQRTWKAQIRLNSTMNGSQQVRIDQSIKSGMAMYDKIDELADQWNSKGWGPLSRANLIAATQGAKGQEAAKVAIQLQGQIAQLTSDVATLEQGGMTPTNEARAVAEKSLQAWWGNGTIKAMTAQGRANMKIRDMARTTQGLFVGGNTQPPSYVEPQDQPAPASAAGAPQQRPIPGIPGAIAELRNGKWIRIK